jgi:hypothetical protein
MQAAAAGDAGGPSSSGGGEEEEDEDPTDTIFAFVGDDTSVKGLEAAGGTVGVNANAGSSNRAGKRPRASL